MPFHIGSDLPISVKDLADLTRERTLALLNKKIDVKILGLSQATEGIHRYVPSNTKTKEVLKVEQSIGLAESLDFMIKTSAKIVND
jgi:nucleoside-diphosphate-sugar epimerase